MLLIEISQIPPEGLGVSEALEPSQVHLEGEADFLLRPGGSLRCRLERVEADTIHVRGRLAAPLGLECGRCLEPFVFAVDQDLDLFYLRHRADVPREEEDEVELEDRDMVVAYYEGDRLDLGETVREQFYLALPMKRLCREDCRGRCPSCGRNRNQEACGCPPQEQASDPRLAGLKKLFDEDRH